MLARDCIEWYHFAVFYLHVRLGLAHRECKGKETRHGYERTPSGRSLLLQRFVLPALEEHSSA